MLDEVLLWKTGSRSGGECARFPEKLAATVTIKQWKCPILRKAGYNGNDQAIESARFSEKLTATVTIKG